MMQRYVVRRQSSLAAAKRILSQADDEPDFEAKSPAPKPKSRQPATKKPRPSPPPRTDASEEDFAPDVEQDESHEIAEPQAKRRKVDKARKATKSETAKLHSSLFGPGGESSKGPCPLPARTHAVSYHRPLLLDVETGRDGRSALLSWFDSISTTRGMPWRRAWIDPASVSDAAELRRALERRAYEVWISEIMLQQTRVAVVIDYWNRWMARWPTIRDLAAAQPEDVLGAWRGLGYYSRATRVHEAARLVVADDEFAGLMPADAAELEAKVPGVGRYTAGAISAIVFGKAAPMVDGNVLRVLSRQLGVFGNVKTEKTVIDLLWAAADALVKAVAEDSDGGEEHGKETPNSDRPGRWGQALMELGSTVCTPKPNCGECPITTTCRAYAEGLQLSVGAKETPKVEDMEDLCSICEPFEEDADDGAASGDDSDAAPKKPAKGTKGKKPIPGPKQATLSAFFSTKTEGKVEADSSKEPAIDAKTLESITNHAKKFPLKVVKKAVREEEALVCAVRRRDGKLLIHRRPEKGLLAGLWELPSHTLPAASSSTAASRKKDAQAYVSGLVSGAKKPRLRHAGDLGSVPWLFSHLKLTMHVHLFEAEGTGDCVSSHSRHKWATIEEIEDESMGTGMRKCWALVKERVVE